MAHKQITTEGRLTRDPERITTHSGTAGPDLQRPNCNITGVTVYAAD